MLLDMEGELTEKETKRPLLSSKIEPIALQESQLDSVKHDMHMIINLLDSVGTNPQLLNQYLNKYISKTVIERESKLLHLTIQLKMHTNVIYEKTIVSELS